MTMRWHRLTFRDPRARPGEAWCLSCEKPVTLEQCGQPCPGKGETR